MKAKEFIEEKKKRAERLLFNFNIAYFYTFIAGILVSLAVNIFTTTILTGSLPISVYITYGMALSLFIASIGAFAVSALHGCSLKGICKSILFKHTKITVFCKN